jgi:malate synthase
MPPSVKFVAPVSSHYKETVLNSEALHFVVHLETKFRAKRKELLSERLHLRKKQPHFLESTRDIREDEGWNVISTPHDLQDRRVEITGPADRKMMINALNSGAKVFMADLEDACSPHWENMLQSFENLNLAVRRQLDFTSEEGKTYKLKDTVATLFVRPRAWHLVEKHLLVDNEPVSASLFDFAIYFFHNAKERLAQGSGPYFYLPKMENHLEARLWNEVFHEAEHYIGVPPSSIRVTALIETLPAAFEMDEILWELRDYIIGLNAGRWDYLFSFIKTLGHSSDHIFPDRQQLTMNVPFMRAYAQLLVQTCHKRKAHAIGGMSAFIPNRKNPEWNEQAFQAVRKDKQREASDGFDGTWVAHPDLVPIAQEVFDAQLGAQPHQKQVLRNDLHVNASDLLQTNVPSSFISLKGFQNNIRIALEYMNQWFNGLGAVAIDNLMEDMATAEISRAQIWQWIQHRCQTQEDITITPELYTKTKTEILNTLTQPHGTQHYVHAAELLDDLVLCKECPDFLSVPAYTYLN